MAGTSPIDFLLKVSEKPEQNDLALDLAVKQALSVKKIAEPRLKTLRLLLETSKNKEYLEYDIWYLERLADRIEAAAKERAERLRSLDTPLKRRLEIEECAADTVTFINRWGWTEDPRVSAPISRIPFVLFPVQQDAVRWIERTAFEEFRNGVMLKSRAMGASWLICYIGLKHYLFAPSGSATRFLYLSKKAEDADKLNDLKSLLEKIRYGIRLLPSWMLPTGFDPKRHLKHRSIYNPANGATITADAFTASAGAGNRATIAFMDEAALGEYAKQQACWKTLSGGVATTTIMVSTPRGTRNQFAVNYHSPGLAKFKIHWTDHPLLSPPEFPNTWYKRMAETMNSPEGVAQELDCAFDASQPGRVFPQYDEPTHVITWAEFAQVFPQAFRNGRYRLPEDFTVGRAMDVGMSEDHPNVITWVARAPLNSPTPGAVYVYRQSVIAGAVEMSRIASVIRSAEEEDGTAKRVSVSVMSHEQTAVQKTLAIEHGIMFTKTNTRQGYEMGIPQIREFLTPRGDAPHVFRPFLPNSGTPRLFLLVADGQGECSEVDGRFVVTPATDDAGLKRLREEFPVYHYAVSEQGKAVNKMRPHKDFDDAIDTLRMLAASFFPPPKSDFRNEAPCPVSFDDLEKLDPAVIAMRLARRPVMSYNRPKKQKVIEVLNRYGKRY